MIDWRYGAGSKLEVSVSEKAVPAHSTGQPMVQRARLPLLALSMVALLAAPCAGLLRLGWTLPAIQPGLYIGHRSTMVCGFLGTLISLERAVALGRGLELRGPRALRGRRAGVDRARLADLRPSLDYGLPRLLRALN